MDNNRLALNIDEKQLPLIDNIDSTGYFQIGAGCQRKDLFAFALALGFRSGHATPLVKRKSLIRKEILGNDKYLYDAVFFKSKVEEDGHEIDQITDDTQVFGIVEDYANTGFDIISDYIQKKYDEETLLFQLLKEIDEANKNFCEDCR